MILGATVWRKAREIRESLIKGIDRGKLHQESVQVTRRGKTFTQKVWKRTGEEKGENKHAAGGGDKPYNPNNAGVFLGNLHGRISSDAALKGAITDVKMSDEDENSAKLHYTVHGKPVTTYLTGLRVPTRELVNDVLQGMKDAVSGADKRTDEEKRADKFVGGNVLTSLNPTGGVHRDHDPKKIMQMKLGENITTLDKTMGKPADTMITVYRGTSGRDIEAGDYVTTNKQLAQDYAGTGKVVSMQVRAADVLDDKTEPLGEEYIYRPQAGKVSLADAKVKAGELGAKAHAAGKKAVPMHDAELMKLIEQSGAGKEVGGGSSDIMAAWMDAWHQSNMDADVKKPVDKTKQTDTGLMHKFTANEKSDLINTWHTMKGMVKHGGGTDTGRHAQLMATVKGFVKEHPHITENSAYKRLTRLLEPNNGEAVGAYKDDEGATEQPKKSSASVKASGNLFDAEHLK